MSEEGQNILEREKERDKKNEIKGTTNKKSLHPYLT